ARSRARSATRMAARPSTPRRSRSTTSPRRSPAAATSPRTRGTKNSSPRGAKQSANEGENKSFSLGSFSDPGSDTPWGVDVDWGDGSTHTTFNSTGAGPAVAKTLGSQSHTYADNGSYTVTVKVTDKDTALGTATFTVTVSNVAPTVTSGGNQASNEGQ